MGRVEKEEDKRKIWKKKRILKERKVWIEEDLTWKERKVRRKLSRVAVEERGKRKSVWMKGNKIRIEKDWWRWNEEKREVEKIGIREKRMQMKWWDGGRDRREKGGSSTQRKKQREQRL